MCKCVDKKKLIIYKKKKNTKSVKKSEIITYQPKIFEDPNIVDIKSITTEHPKTSHKLSKTIRQAEKVDSNSSLYSAYKKGENVKITKREHAFKGFESTYNIEI